VTGEALTPAMLLGLLIVLSGVILVLTGGRPSQAPAGKSETPNPKSEGLVRPQKVPAPAWTRKRAGGTDRVRLLAESGSS
jgi:hypothetical protein